MGNSSKPKKQRGCESETRRWGDLGNDVLLIIYQKLDLEDLIVGAPLCCTSWYTASKNPCLWRVVDLRRFNSHKGKLVPSSQLVEFVVARSQGSLTSIAFPLNSAVDDLLLVAERCPSVEHLSLRISEQKIQEGKKTIAMSIAKLKKLQGMEVDEVFISDDSTLQHIGQSCPNLIKLKVYDSVSKNTALLIAIWLPKLKILDISSTKIHRKEVLAILNGCLELENLDLNGCGKIYSEDEILRIGLTRLKKFKWDNERRERCSECEEDISESELEYFEYRFPCTHDMDNAFYDHIDGTDALAEELHPYDRGVGPPTPPFLDYSSGEEEDYNYECDCHR